MKIGIIANAEGDERHIVSACKEMGVEYELIYLFSDRWLEEFQHKPCDGYILRPAAYMSIWRNVYLRRVFLLRDQLEGRCVPTLDSLVYYESKILMADLFQRMNIPHAKTETFFCFRDAWEYASQTSLPKIVKTDGGAGGTGVKKIKTRTGLRWQVLRSFLTNYTARGIHSLYELKKACMGRVSSWRDFLKNRDHLLILDKSHSHIIFQDFIDAPFEWRIVVIGKSFFGHQKLPGKNKLHSGSGRVGWVAPPFALLDQVRQWYEALRLNSMTFDILEDRAGNYYVNEMQAVMGAYAPNQMYIDGVPGRYIHTESGWKFEEGEFGRHSCNILRIETLIELLLQQQQGVGTCTPAAKHNSDSALDIHGI